MAFIVWLDEALKEVLIYLFIQSFVDLQSDTVNAATEPS